jgi:glutaminase
VTTQHVLSLLYSAGCETQSGEFSFQVGVPAKSSREGVILLVVPNVLGMCVAAPSLNRHGVSKSGLNFCFAFSELFNCHALSGASSTASKYDPTLYNFHTDMDLCSELLAAAESGNCRILKMITSIGFDVNYTDYDGRSAAHVAAGMGHCQALKFLYKHGADLSAADRWGVTPFDQAKRNGKYKAEALINSLRSETDSVADCGDGESVMSCQLTSSRLQSVQRTHMATAAKALGSLDSLREDDGETSSLSE